MAGDTKIVGMVVSEASVGAIMENQAVFRTKHTCKV